MEQCTQCGQAIEKGFHLESLCLSCERHSIHKIEAEMRALEKRLTALFKERNKIRRRLIPAPAPKAPPAPKTRKKLDDDFWFEEEL